MKTQVGSKQKQSQYSFHSKYKLFVSFLRLNFNIHIHKIVQKNNDLSRRKHRPTSIFLLLAKRTLS